MNKYFLMFLSLVIFIIITAQQGLNHFPWYDESHAWIISEFLNVHNALEIEKIEGHPLIWYIILAPFAKNNFMYPYPMLIINYVCCIAALIILWLKSNFNNYLKIIITFSSMVVLYFAIVARSYSLSLVFLFLLCTFYNQQTEKPLKYSLLILLTSQINYMGAISACGFSIVFIVKMLKVKDFNNLLAPFCILFLSLILCVYPYIKGVDNVAFFSVRPPSIVHLFHFFTYSKLHILMFISYIFNILYLLYKTKSDYCKLYLFFTTFALFLLFHFIYPGGMHHYVFLFVNIIITMWIAQNEHSEKYPLLFYLAITTMLLIPLKKDFSYCYYDNAKPVADFINTSLSGKKVYIDVFTVDILPYINTKTNIYDFVTKTKLNYNNVTAFYDLDGTKKQANTLEKGSYLLTWYSDLSFPLIYQFKNKQKTYYIYKIVN